MQSLKPGSDPYIKRKRGFWLQRKHVRNLYILVLLMALFASIEIGKLHQDARRSRIREDLLSQNCFRRQYLDDKTAAYIQKEHCPGTTLGLYWLETNYGEDKFLYKRSPETFQELERQWESVEGYDAYMDVCSSIWDDIQYFPIPEAQNDPELTVSFADSWMNERTYGGKRGHEGTDIMPSESERGLYPIVSMTDGVVVNKGWLEKGGYRLGIVAPQGAYFYYAHMDSYADVEVGDVVQAGDLLGYMGDTGYGPEGTTGQFPVHLHVGIYIYPNETEISINPYPILRYLEDRKIKCVYTGASSKSMVQCSRYSQTI